MADPNPNPSQGPFRDYYDQRGSSFTGPTGMGGDADGEQIAPTRRSNIPPLPQAIVDRPALTKTIHEALEVEGTRTSVLRQATAWAHGGYGKTVAALLYADEYRDRYPGGCYFLSMEDADLNTCLSSLASHLGIDETLKPEQQVPKVKLALELFRWRAGGGVSSSSS